jgi:oligopeptide/dipeptide ABC transporter ATP-binding protein
MIPLLDVQNVTKRFRIRRTGFRREYLVAVSEISFRVFEDQPRITAIAGESGSGKTTLVRMLLGFHYADDGRVEYRGVSVPELDADSRRRYRTDIQAVFQDPFEVYNPYYRVDHILETPLRKFGIATHKVEIRERIEEALLTVGLRPDETLGRFPHQISGGQRQRTMIARALLLNPKLIVADEPVSMVDASLRATILDKLLQLNKDLGISLIYVTHDLTTAYQLCDDMVILYQGRVVELGDVESVIKSPQHPYTELLVRSIPLPDPDKTWSDPEDKLGAADVRGTGCPFAARCTHVMDQCRESEPPLYRLSDTHSARCYLHKTHPIVQAWSTT